MPSRYPQRQRNRPTRIPKININGNGGQIGDLNRLIQRTLLSNRRRRRIHMLRECAIVNENLARELDSLIGSREYEITYRTSNISWQSGTTLLDRENTLL
jgi:hypothetical protein